MYGLTPESKNSDFQSMHFCNVITTKNHKQYVLARCERKLQEKNQADCCFGIYHHHGCSDLPGYTGGRPHANQRRCQRLLSEIIFKIGCLVKRPGPVKVGPFPF